MPITMLSVLWLCAAAALAVTAVAVAVSAPADALTRAAGSITAIALAGVAAALGVGLWVRAPWARPLQLATAGVGLLVCPFSLAAASILLYMTRPSARAQFEPAAHGAPDRATAQADVAFTAAILGTTLLGVAVGIVALMVPRLLLARSSAPRLSSRETTVLRRMQAVGAAESAFRTGTCEGYADLDALVHPEVVIPNYPAQGPAFLAAELAAPEAVGYRFHLGVEGPLPPAEGCPSRSYRGYTLTATPVTGAGHHFLMRSDRIVRAAEGRPATLADPPLQ